MTDQRAAPLEGRRIAFFTRYGEAGPSSRMRFYLYRAALEASGARVIPVPFLGNGYVARYFATGEKSRVAMAIAFATRFAAIVRAKYDLIWVEKEVFPFLPGPFEAGFRARVGRYVVDYDDAIFHNYDASGSRLVRTVLGDKLDPLLAGATLVTAGNDYLARYAAARGARAVLDVPTVVDTARYPVLAPVDDGAICVGWIGTPGNAAYLAPVVAALNRLGERLPVRLLTIGAGEVPGLAVPHERHDWTAQSEAASLSRIDIGVMPLVDSPWERGKCGFKLIQYMAAGRPVVASPVGVNAAIVTPEVGFLATTVDEWAARIEALAIDAPMRRAMGQAARRRVEAHYSLQVTAPRIVASFARILSD